METRFFQGYGLPPEDQQKGFYVFFYIHAFSFDEQSKKVDYQVWMKSIFEKNIQRAEQFVEREAIKDGLWEDMKQNPGNMYMQVFGVKLVERMIETEYDQPIVKEKPEISTTTLEALAKNMVMKKIINDKDNALFKKIKKEFTKEEQKYIHNKIKT